MHTGGEAGGGAQRWWRRLRRADSNSTFMAPWRGRALARSYTRDLLKLSSVLRPEDLAVTLNSGSNVDFSVTVAGRHCRGAWAVTDTLKVEREQLSFKIIPKDFIQSLYLVYYLRVDKINNDAEQ